MDWHPSVRGPTIISTKRPTSTSNIDYFSVTSSTTSNTVICLSWFTFLHSLSVYIHHYIFEFILFRRPTTETTHSHWTPWRMTTTITMRMTTPPTTTTQTCPTSPTAVPAVLISLRIWLIRCSSVPFYSYYCYSLWCICCCPGGSGNNIFMRIRSVTRGRHGVIRTAVPRRQHDLSHINIIHNNNISSIMGDSSTRVLRLGCRYVLSSLVR